MTGGAAEEGRANGLRCVLWRVARCCRRPAGSWPWVCGRASKQPGGGPPQRRVRARCHSRRPWPASRHFAASACARTMVSSHGNAAQSGPAAHRRWHRAAIPYPPQQARPPSPARSQRRPACMFLIQQRCVLPPPSSLLAVLSARSSLVARRSVGRRRR